MKYHIKATTGEGKIISKGSNDKIVIELSKGNNKMAHINFIGDYIEIWHGKGLLRYWTTELDNGLSKSQKQKGECLHKNTEWRDEDGKSYLNCFDCGDVLRTK